MAGTNGTKTTMKAAQMDPKDLKIKINQIPIPKPTADQVLVKILCASLCHSDIMIFDPTPGMQLPDKPTTMGHEATGQIVELGANARGLKVGDKVGFNPATGVCYECYACIKVHNLWCEKTPPMMQGFGIDGYFAEYAVADWHNTMVLPPDLDPYAAAPLFCAGVTAFHGINDLKLETGSWVAVIGCGGLGLMGIQYAVAMGYKVIGIDTAAVPREEALAAGASHVFDPSAKADAKGRTYVDQILEITGRGVDAAVNFTDSKRAYEAMPAILRPGRGILMAVGIPSEPVSFSIYDISLNKYRIMGANNGQCYNLPDAINFSAKHKIASKIEYYNLEDLPKMVEKLQNHTVRGRLGVKF